MTRTTAAKLLDVSTSTVKRVELLPDVQERIAHLREVWKSVAHDKLTGMADKAWKMADDLVDQRDASGFNKTIWGLNAMEKISSSLTGEGQKVEITGVPAAPQVDVKALLIQLFGPTTPPRD